MSLMSVTLEGEASAFRPGDTIQAVAEWDLPGVPQGIVAALIWTAGSGGPHTEEGVAVSVSIDRPKSRERRLFELQAPSGPYLSLIHI